MMAAIANHRGTVPIFGRTIHGRSLRRTSMKESVRAVTSGRTRVAWITAMRRSCRWPRAKSGRCCAGQIRSATRIIPRSARANGPITTTRRLVTDPANAAPPQPVDHPTPTSTPAAAGMLRAGRYTFDERAARALGMTWLVRSAARGVAGGPGGTRVAVTAAARSLVVVLAWAVTRERAVALEG